MVRCSVIRFFLSGAACNRPSLKFVDMLEFHPSLGTVAGRFHEAISSVVLEVQQVCVCVCVDVMLCMAGKPNALMLQIRL